MRGWRRKTAHPGISSPLRPSDDQHGHASQESPAASCLFRMVPERPRSYRMQNVLQELSNLFALWGIRMLDAILIPLLNPDEVLEGARPKFGTAVLLDRDGRGVRDLVFA